ncbi:hypothetical protein DENSPDRAFT_851621 [Dentipellis sp. KUC8613]|nr:hypothetical protein DENSPDRAFT_851621 [Dentipellis sp. KUC8613]
MDSGDEHSGFVPGNSGFFDMSAYLEAEGDAADTERNSAAPLAEETPSDCDPCLSEKPHGYSWKLEYEEMKNEHQNLKDELLNALMFLPPYDTDPQLPEDKLDTYLPLPRMCRNCPELREHRTFWRKSFYDLQSEHRTAIKSLEGKVTQLELTVQFYRDRAKKLDACEARIRGLEYMISRSLGTSGDDLENALAKQDRMLNLVDDRRRKPLEWNIPGSDCATDGDEEEVENNQACAGFFED